MKITIRRAKKKRHGRHRWLVVEEQTGHWIATYTVATFRCAVEVAIGLRTDERIPVNGLVDVSIREWRP